MDILSVIVLSVTLVSCFLTFVSIAFLFMLYRDVSRLQDVNIRVYQITQMLHSLSNAINLHHAESIMSSVPPAFSPPPRSPKIWRSADGKHSAGSMEELLEKMSKDPTYSDMDMNSLREQLDNMEDLPEMNDEEDDDEDQQWKKKKK